MRCSKGIFLFPALAVAHSLIGCSRAPGLLAGKQYGFGGTIGHGVTDPKDLPGLQAEFDKLCKGLESMGFVRVSEEDTPSEKAAAYKGEYQGVQNVQVAVSCLKHVTQARAELRAETSSAPNYDRDTLSKSREFQHVLEKLLK